MKLSYQNISMENFIKMKENTQYDPHPNNSNGLTVYKQETRIQIKSLFALASMP